MITRTLRQVLPHAQQGIVLPPTFLLPLRARFSTTSSTAEPRLSSTAFQSPPPPPPPFPPPYSSKSSNRSPIPISAESSLNQPQPSLSNSSHRSSSLALLPVLAAQSPHYIIVRIHQRPYLLTHGDSLRLPFNLHNAPPGTILRLTRASALGSRDYTFRGKPLVDEKFFVCRVQVVGVEGESMRVMEKTKRRQRHIKRVKSKMRYTVVRCVELRILTEAEAEAQSGKGDTHVEPKLEAIEQDTEE